jgi:hypothetical protein
MQCIARGESNLVGEFEKASHKGDNKASPLKLRFDTLGGDSPHLDAARTGLRGSAGRSARSSDETLMRRVRVERVDVPIHMKTCDSCGDRVYREAPTNAEYGLAVVDGQRYPDECPGCGGSL